MPQACSLEAYPARTPGPSEVCIDGPDLLAIRRKRMPKSSLLTGRLYKIGGGKARGKNELDVVMDGMRPGRHLTLVVAQTENLQARFTELLRARIRPVGVLKVLDCSIGIRNHPERWSRSAKGGLRILPQFGFAARLLQVQFSVAYLKLEARLSVLIDAREACKVGSCEHSGGLRLRVARTQ